MRERRELGLKSFQEMGLVSRMRFLGQDDAAKAEAGLGAYYAANQKVRQAVDENSAAHQRLRGAINAFTAETGKAETGTLAWVYVTRKLITEFDEVMRGQRGQMISTLGSTIRDFGLRALPLVAGIGAAFAAIKLTQ